MKSKNIIAQLIYIRETIIMKMTHLMVQHQNITMIIISAILLMMLVMGGGDHSIEYND